MHARNIAACYINHVPEFKNLYELFSYVDFCPLCNKRLSPFVVLPISTKYMFSGPRLKLLGKFSIEVLEVNLIDNTFIARKRTLQSVNILTNSIQLIVGQQCNKYHFKYSGSASLNMNDKTVANIKLDNWHLLQRIDNNYFTVNTFFEQDNYTSIKISNGKYDTQEVIINNTAFNISSRKKIVDRLKNIALLT